MKKMYILPMTIVLLATIPGLASAAEDASRFRLHLDTTLFSFSKATFAEDGFGEPGDDVSSMSYGFGDNLVNNSQMFGFGMGYLITKNLIVGTKVSVGGGATEYKDDLFEFESRYFSYAALPYLELRFLSGNIQPFVLATVGYRGSAGWDKDNEEQKMFTHLVEFGGALGAHFFVAENFSIDASVTATGDFGKVVLEGGDENESKVDIKGFQTAAVVGISGWF